MDKIDTVANNPSSTSLWNDVDVKMLVVDVKKKDVKKIENFFTSKGFSVIEN